MTKKKFKSLNKELKFQTKAHEVFNRLYEKCFEVNKKQVNKIDFLQYENAKQEDEIKLLVKEIMMLTNEMNKMKEGHQSQKAGI